MPSEAGRSIEASILRLTTVTGLLAASESRSSAILEHAAIGIWTIGIDGRIRSANAAAARMVGLEAGAQRGSEAHRVPARLRRRAADASDAGTLDPGADPGGDGAGRAGAVADRVRPRHLGAQAVRGTARAPGSPRCADRPPQPVRRARAPRERVDERRRPVRRDVRRHRRLQERQRFARSRDRRPRAARDRRSDPRARAPRRLRGPSRWRRVPDRDARLRGHDDGRVVRLPADPRDRAAVPLRRPPVRWSRRASG